MKAVLVFVEGSADGWFVLRCLGAGLGASFVKQKPSDYPTPFGGRENFISRWHARIAPVDLHLAEGAEGFQPVFQAVARTVDTWFFIIRMGGDRKVAEVASMVHDLVTVMNSPDASTFGIQSLQLAFFYDSDTPSHYNSSSQNCVDLRQQWFRSEFGSHFLGTDIVLHGSWANGQDFPIGLWVFHDPATRQGTLEDAIEPALKASPAPWPDRIDAAEVFLSSNQNVGDDVVGSPSERAKARITIAGQFNRAGHSMAGIVKRGRVPVVPDSVFNTPLAQSLVQFLSASP